MTFIEKPKWLPNIPSASFFEKYGDWTNYGPGVMLVSYHDGKCEYVKFTNEETGYREIINDELLKRYYKEMKDD